ncbi:hypothetical protein RVR_5801 [Actinacidiphila reveromycinica]|uniref:SpdD protein n=1 Tax=Actinacidiphila reveromycinica TaxID=659352 RepID=A0A7U3VQ03_9ACTN|nr:hypothetical protein [Streptomyces sp. SN-593]BBA99260.1 hypothetical protein RVR_5801 [Streptomyces sp. SN-593]
MNLRPPGPHQPASPDATLVQIGVDDQGGPLYAYRQTAPTVMPAPLVHRPWGAYAALGCGFLFALTVVGVVLVAIVIGFAIALAVLAVCMVTLMICLVVLRGLWKDVRRG